MAKKFYSDGAIPSQNPLEREVLMTYHAGKVFIQDEFLERIRKDLELLLSLKTRLDETAAQLKPEHTPKQTLEGVLETL